MSTWEQVAQEADDAVTAKDVKGCYEILRKAHENGVHHLQLTWRYARALYDMAEETTEKREREKYFKEGLEWAKKAVEEDPNFYASHKWLGILLSAQNEFISTKEKVANAYIIRDHFLKALELKDDDATSLHCMGMWCWNVLQVGWVERQAASLLFGTPPTSTYDDCLKYLLAADKFEPSIHTALAIGNVHLQLKQKDQAKIWYQKAIDLPAGTEAQMRQQAEARKKIASC
ncbi:regulator of microtubule dynamics protein 1 [Trypanosoma grayi]|uniref:regulator of microtubule dynamics protein 1 n=1 Tax=Trypanosoma grayi TaxID=71804 RepID=UPI0004F43CEF|nr:regulator of microtubule dynamics protein 1 [Trypanosoma grayi]KEG09505.1 regulator of microtubule dynamics protein 1 [Trypanosoma grayi]